MASGWEPLLQGDKVLLRPFGAEDINEAYIGWLNDPVVTRFSNQRFRTHDRASCEAYLATFGGTPNLLVSIRRRDDDRAVGTMTAYVSPHHGTADVGILLGDRSVWGQGYGQEAWNLMIDWLLSRPRMRKVTAGTLAVNRPMIRLAERSGMLLEGVRREQELVDGQAIDIFHFARFRDV